MKQLYIAICTAFIFLTSVPSSSSAQDQSLAEYRCEHNLNIDAETRSGYGGRIAEAEELAGFAGGDRMTRQAGEKIKGI